MPIEAVIVLRSLASRTVGCEDISELAEHLALLKGGDGLCSPGCGQLRDVGCVEHQVR